MRIYTDKEILAIKRRQAEITQRFCFILLGAVVNGHVSEAEAIATKKLKIRCPLSISGECTKCVVTGDQIDMYQAVRDLNLVVKDA